MSTGYAIVGAGWFAQELARLVAALPGARVAAVLPGPAEVAGAAVCGTVTEVLARADVDAVLLAAPDPEVVIAAAHAGRHVFCERPIASSSADCAAMLEAVRAAGVVFLAGNVLHFADGIEGARASVRGGAIGTLVYVRAVRTGGHPHGGAGPWGVEPDPAAPPHHHELDLVLSLLGEPDQVTMAGLTGDAAAPAAPADLLLAILEFPGGRFATLEFGSALTWPQHHLLLSGTEGSVRVELRGQEEHPGRPALWLRGLLSEEVAYFHSLVNGAAPTPDLAALTDTAGAAVSARTAQALALSLAEDRKVSLSEIG